MFGGVAIHGFVVIMFGGVADGIVLEDGIVLADGIVLIRDAGFIPA